MDFRLQTSNYPDLGVGSLTRASEYRCRPKTSQETLNLGRVVAATVLTALASAPILSAIYGKTRLIPVEDV